MSRSLTAGDLAVADAETLRKASLKRALLATGVLMALTASLWLVEGGETAELPAPVAVSAPAAAPVPAPPASAAQVADPVVHAMDAAPVAAEQGASGVAAPPGRDGLAQSAPAASEVSPPAVPAAAVPAPTVTPPVDDDPAPPAAPPRADAPRLHAGAPPGPGYLVQLGVFLDAANADSMRRELERKGYPAHLQARVVLGPYPDRKAALAAQEKVRRERKLDGMILAPRK